MQLLDLLVVSATTTSEAVICLVESRCSRTSRTRDVGERMENQASDDRVSYDANDCNCNPLDQRNDWNR